MHLSIPQEKAQSLGNRLRAECPDTYKRFLTSQCIRVTKYYQVVVSVSIADDDAELVRKCLVAA